MKLTALILALAAGTAQAQFLTGNSLLQMLDDRDTSLAGLGYVMGVYDATVAVIHCPPENVTSGQTRDMTAAWLRANPQARHLGANMLVVHVLRSAWPCAKAGKSL